MRDLRSRVEARDMAADRFGAPWIVNVETKLPSLWRKGW